MEVGSVEEFIRTEVNDWDNEVMVNARFKAFGGQRSDWEPKYIFWKDLIIKIARRLGLFIIRKSEIKNVWFCRRGLNPLCLDDVLTEMYKSGDILKSGDLVDPTARGKLFQIFRRVLGSRGSSSSNDFTEDHLILSELLKASIMMNIEGKNKVKVEIEDTYMENEEGRYIGKRKQPGRGRPLKIVINNTTRESIVTNNHDFVNNNNRSTFVPEIESDNTARCSEFGDYTDTEISSINLANQIKSSAESLARNVSKMIEEHKSATDTMTENVIKMIEENVNKRRERMKTESELKCSLAKACLVRDEVLVENNMLRARVGELEKSVDHIFSVVELLKNKTVHKG